MISRGNENLYKVANPHFSALNPPTNKTDYGTVKVRPLIMTT